MNEDDYISIPKEVYEQLVEDSALLWALRNKGVDNWEGYEDALDEVFYD